MAFAVAGFMLWCESGNPIRDDGISRPGNGQFGRPQHLISRAGKLGAKPRDLIGKFTVR
jgi:hypothetical protein